MKLSLEEAWEARFKLHAEGDKLRAEGYKLRAEGDKLYAESATLYAEGDKLRAEGDKLRAEGDLIFINAVIRIKGNIKIKWISKKHRFDCELETGEYFRADALADVAELQ